MNTYETILVEHAERVVTITLNRPKALNALNSTVMREVVSVIRELDDSDEVGCFVLAGSEKAFAAGADITEMAKMSATDMYTTDFFSGWDELAGARTPLIAAVAGYALGGGCEVAMTCDFIIAAENARFGQPEVGLGTLPGMGGSQRLARAVGKAKAMDMCLTGRHITAEEAERAGLVARVVPTEELATVAAETAATVAGYSKVATSMTKKAVNMAFETPLTQGVANERQLFNLSFASEDRREGMAAFVEKREAEFRHR
ncbi:enoyl-CoA hydratase-related protein [Corynebacterium guangdongense]|uniref:Enoyl-CoA hydratase n=1 Tax=Corynebacterium guangdongense TaxID=1783348 RepID=A0ABU1ZTY0_9CORY|nr:enoyl-CoA hydratase-related protein [Corynebacterium guangdongense]MDR7328388.1 enoyl-CoA hydratase [Corynebacterium guangdongense]WJZ16965.1 putative enoyl-CoA hydratase echA8 [Corynebacterium guangdongense]